jgi:hypothetical protein
MVARELLRVSLHLLPWQDRFYILRGTSGTDCRAEMTFARDINDEIRRDDVQLRVRSGASTRFYPGQSQDARIRKARYRSGPIVPLFRLAVLLSRLDLTDRSRNRAVENSNPATPVIRELVRDSGI